MVAWHKPLEASGQAIFPGSRVLAALGLVYFAPVLLAVAILLKFGSSRPVFARRHGRTVNGDSIALWEFRTAPAAEGTFTALDEFLRDTRLVRLPRLLNILRGELPMKAMFELI